MYEEYESISIMTKLQGPTSNLTCSNTNPFAGQKAYTAKIQGEPKNLDKTLFRAMDPSMVSLSPL